METIFDDEDARTVTARVSQDKRMEMEKCTPVEDK